MVTIDSWWDSRTRDRFEAILELVIDAIADDYERLDVVLRTINEWYPSDPGLGGWKALKAVPVSRREVVKALRELTEEGYAQAYRYEERAQQYRSADFREDEVDNLWFYVTAKGIHSVKRLQERYSEKN